MERIASGLRIGPGGGEWFIVGIGGVPIRAGDCADKLEWAGFLLVEFEGDGAAIGEHFAVHILIEFEDEVEQPGIGADKFGAGEVIFEFFEAFGEGPDALHFCGGLLFEEIFELFAVGFEDVVGVVVIPLREGGGGNAEFPADGADAFALGAQADELFFCFV